MPLCFDLDGTLGTFGSGYLLLRQALGELWQDEPTLEELRTCKGSTDWEIVDELHRRRFDQPLAPGDFARYERACLARFRETFGPGGERPEVYGGLVAGLALLWERGHEIWLVSGNVPAVLDFKARCLGIPRGLPMTGSLPGTDRTDLLRHALGQGSWPHLYAGDRPHDLAAATRCGIPFLGIGPHVQEAPLVIGTDSSARGLVTAVERLVAAS